MCLYVCMYLVCVCVVFTPVWDIIVHVLYGTCWIESQETAPNQQWTYYDRLISAGRSLYVSVFLFQANRQLMRVRWLFRAQEPGKEEERQTR